MVPFAERLEFASSEWVAAASKLLEEAVAEAGSTLDGTSFSMCESFSNAPPHLARPGNVAAWHARFRGASVVVDEGDVDDVDFKITGDYSAALPVARTVYGRDPHNAARAQRENAHRVAGDVLSLMGSPPPAPVMKVLMKLHDGLARRTVDNPDLPHRLAGHGLLQHAADLRERGYTILENAITQAFADELREAILAKIAEHDPPRAAAMLLERGRLFEEAIQHPWVMALAEQVCGKGFLLAQSIGIRRGPGPGLPLHSDYNLMREPFPAYSQACTTIFALEDFTLADGATLVVPGSIREQRHPRPGEADARAIPIEMPKGSIAMWDGATWHGSATRQTDGERVTLHNTYSRMTLRTYDFYRDIDPAILERNPPDVTTLAGLDDLFEKNTWAGPDFRRLAHATRIFRT